MAKVSVTDWGPSELAGAVAAYRKMQQLEQAGEHYVKRHFYADLESRFGRDAKAFERRMQNISSVLNDMGEPWLKGLFPAANVGRGVSTQLRRLLAPQGLPSYHAKLPEMRRWLIEVARHRDTVRYGELMAAFDIDRYSLRAALGILGGEARRRGEPILTALVINAKTGHCSEGIFKSFGVHDDAAERIRLYDFWRSTPDRAAIDLEPTADDSLEARASRFARQEVRPEQAAFRRRIYLAFGGVCVVSGCNIRTALDAAHLRGRDWRKGHNRASDGLLLRKDLHALYDAGLLHIDQQGVASISPAALPHYQAYDSVQVKRVLRSRG